MKYKDFFNKTKILLLKDMIPYINYLDELLDNDCYKTFLFFDEISTNIIRLHWKPNKDERKNYFEISEKLGISCYRLEQIIYNIYMNTSSQVSITYKYYKKYEMSRNLIGIFKKSIESVDIDGDIKKFIIKNKLNNLEQLLIGNMINWGNQSIKETVKVMEYFESKKLEFNDKSYIQSTIQELNLTEEEIRSLEKNNIITCNDLENINYNGLKSMDLSAELTKKLIEMIGLTYNEIDFFKKINFEITGDNIDYLKCLVKILFYENYRTFLFFDEVDTKIIRLYYSKIWHTNIKQKELPELLGLTSNQIIQRLSNLPYDISVQIEKTFNFYKKNRISLEKIDCYKKNIENLEIDNEIKEFIIKNKVNNLEQFIIQNPINWKDVSIRMIKKVLDFYKQYNDSYENMKYEQIIIYNLKISENDITNLEKNKIITFNDIYNIGYNDLKYLNISDETKERIIKSINLDFKVRGLFEKINVNITEESKQYMDLLEKILFDDDYKAFLFLDEVETRIIRMRHCQRSKIEPTNKQISEMLGISECKIQKLLNNIYKHISQQINSTFEFYKKNNMSMEQIEYFKRNISEVDIDKNIKEFILKNGIDTLERFLIQNPINWDKQPVGMVKSILEYFEENGMHFENKDDTQKLVEKLNLTKNEVYVLEQNGISTLEKIGKLELGKLEKILVNVPVLIRKLRRSEIRLNIRPTTNVEALKIRYWTGQKIIRSGFKTVGNLINNTLGDIQEQCNLTDGEMEEVKFRLSEFGLEFKKGRQLIK